MVTQQEIEQGLESLGLERGELVLVHSSLSSFGRVSGGAEAVVKALLTAIGLDGTLVVPTFNWDPGLFLREETPSICGAITEAVRKDSRAIRSSHPTHSVAAIGPLAEEITRDHEKFDSFAPGSALHKMLGLECKILLIGVGHTKSSMIHVAEEIAEVPYLDRVRQVMVEGASGRPLAKIIRRPGCSQGFGKIADAPEIISTLRETIIGKSHVQLVPATSVVSAAVHMLEEDSTSLLCMNPNCQACAEARAMVAATEVQENDQALGELLRDPVGDIFIPFEDYPNRGMFNAEDLN